MVKLCWAISSIFNEYQLTFLLILFREHTFFVTHPRKNCFSSVFQLLLRYSRQLVVWVYEHELFSFTHLTSWNPAQRCLDLLVLLESCIRWLKLTFKVVKSFILHLPECSGDESRLWMLREWPCWCLQRGQVTRKLTWLLPSGQPRLVTCLWCDKKVLEIT